MTLTVVDSGRNNRVSVGAGVREAGRGTVRITGNDNEVVIPDGCSVHGLRLDVSADNTAFVLSGRNVLGGTFVLSAGGARFEVGADTTMLDVKVVMNEGRSIRIGEDCMLGGDVRINVGDLHSLIDASTGKRINPPADVTLARHVWVGQGVTINKGVTIGENSVVGAKALVIDDVPAGSLAVGVPARVARQGVTWARELMPVDESSG